MNRTTATLCLSILLAVTAFGSAQDTMLKDTTESKYEVGQVWSYKTRPGEKASTFVVVKVESHPKLGNVVHIALRDLKIRKPDGNFIEAAGHLPFAEAAIDVSAVKLLKEKAELPDYEEGYGLWREAFEAGEAGVYTMGVAEAVGVMEEALNQ